LTPIIKKFLDPSYRVYTDRWLSFSSLKEEGYYHKVVLGVDGFKLTLTQPMALNLVGQK